MALLNLAIRLPRRVTPLHRPLLSSAWEEAEEVVVVAVPAAGVGMQAVGKVIWELEVEVALAMVAGELEVEEAVVALRVPLMA